MANFILMEYSYISFLVSCQVGLALSARSRCARLCRLHLSFPVVAVEVARQLGVHVTRIEHRRDRRLRLLTQITILRLRFARKQWEGVFLRRSRLAELAVLTSTLGTGSPGACAAITRNQYFQTLQQFISPASELKHRLNFNTKQ